MSDYIGIKLTQNKITIIDENMENLLSQFKWCACYAKNTKSFYAGRNRSRIINNGKQRREMLASYVIGHPLKGFVIDHINGNTLDNRRENLRIVSNRKNNQNRYYHRSGEKLLGASFHKASKLWRARIKINGKEKCLGYFKTKEDSNRRYIQEIKRLNLK